MESQQYHYDNVYNKRSHSKGLPLSKLLIQVQVGFATQMMRNICYTNVVTCHCIMQWYVVCIHAYYVYKCACRQSGSIISSSAWCWLDKPACLQCCTMYMMRLSGRKPAGHTILHQARQILVTPAYYMTIDLVVKLSKPVIIQYPPSYFSVSSESS